MHMRCTSYKILLSTGGYVQQSANQAFSIDRKTTVLITNATKCVIAQKMSSHSAAHFTVKVTEFSKER